MPIYQALVLGVVQGLSEFFPISSSGHLILVPWLFGWALFAGQPDPSSFNKTFDVALHVGTFVGAFFYFRKDIVKYLKAFVASIGARAIRSADERIAMFLVIASIPGALAGALAEKIIEEHLGQPWLIATMLIVFGVLLAVVDRVARKDRNIEDLRARDAVWLGLAQALALSPGVSRSGVTITTARWRGLTREAAVRFSFLMSLPIIGGAGLYKGLKLAVGPGMPPGMGPPFVAGMAAAAGTGFLAVAVTLRVVRKRSFDGFVLYRFAAAALVLGLIVAGVRHATI